MLPWSQRFFLIFHRMRELRDELRDSREAANTSWRSGEKEKPLVTLDLNLTFMQTPAVKRVNLIIHIKGPMEA